MKKSLFLSLLVALLLISCVEDEDTITQKKLKSKATVVKVANLDKLKVVFQPYQYTFDDWDNGVQEIPRLTFSGITPKWQRIIEDVPVENKKSFFFRLMLPLILMSNEKILNEREVVKEGNLLSPEFISIAIKYRVIKDESEALTSEHQKILLDRVNTIPPSLALAQAAEESGWGTSRFTLEGNAFFGQWDFSGKGIKPKEARESLGDYGIARFKTPLASVEGYMLNINTTSAYKALRDLRAQQIRQSKNVSGLLLASTLIKYSERGEDYISALSSLIRYNNLSDLDKAFLSDNNPLHLVF
jgi:uncharacterized FlgJ-related protein